MQNLSPKDTAGYDIHEAESLTMHNASLVGKGLTHLNMHPISLQGSGWPPSATLSIHAF